MRIKWYGHACFRLEDGVSVVTDPYDPEVAGLEPVDEPADVVVASSLSDPYHSCFGMVPGDPRLVDALGVAKGDGVVEVEGVRIEAFPTMESVEHKASPEENAMYRIELGGLAVLHLGDVGNPLPEDHLERLRGRVDVLLALAGGPPTMELDDLQYAIEEIGARLVIPMHYRIPNLTIAGNILPVEEFSSRFPEDAIIRAGSPQAEITPQTLPDRLRILILEPACS